MSSRARSGSESTPSLPRAGLPESPRCDDAVLDPARLAAVRGLGLLEAPASPAFGRLARLAAKMARAPVALGSLVDDDRQFFAGSLGLTEPWASSRQTPLSHSFCQHVVRSGSPLTVADALRDLAAAVMTEVGLREQLRLARD